jgi:hypothetical protein
VFGWFKKQEATAKPHTDPENKSLQEPLMDLLKGHGLDVTTYDGWLAVNNNLPVLCGSYRVTRLEPTVMLHMDIELRLSAERSIWEQSGNWGATEEKAVGMGLFKFCTGAFHVFLSAYWDHHEPDQVEIEHWTIGGAPWNAYTGAMISNASEGQKAGFPKEYMAAVEEAIGAIPLTPEDHWFSFYGANHKNELTMEARLDNEIWPEFNEKLAELNWPPAEGFYSQRNFILLRPASAPSVAED